MNEVTQCSDVSIAEASREMHAYLDRLGVVVELVEADVQARLVQARSDLRAAIDRTVDSRVRAALTGVARAEGAQ